MRALAIPTLLGLGLWLAPQHHAMARDCNDGGSERVWASGGLGLASGAAASFGSSGIISAADDTRDYSFLTGALVGLAVTGGLSALYTLVDGSTGCDMAADGIAWSVPITTLVVGAALPLAIWGASDELGAPTGDATAALRIGASF
jgi:hypothetical protein